MVVFAAIDLLQFLEALGISDKDVIRWANVRVRTAGSPLQIHKASDVTLRNGVYLLQLEHAVAPESVDMAEILEPATSMECKLNAKYAISCAHKLGCRVFLTWEDILEVKPRAIITLLAAIMAIDMHRRRLDKAGMLEQVDIAEPAVTEPPDPTPRDQHREVQTTAHTPPQPVPVATAASKAGNRARRGARMWDRLRKAASWWAQRLTCGLFERRHATFPAEVKHAVSSPSAGGPSAPVVRSGTRDHRNVRSRVGKQRKGSLADKERRKSSLVGAVQRAYGMDEADAVAIVIGAGVAPPPPPPLPLTER